MVARVGGSGTVLGFTIVFFVAGGLGCDAGSWWVLVMFMVCDYRR